MSCNHCSSSLLWDFLKVNVYQLSSTIFWIVSSLIESILSGFSQSLSPLIQFSQFRCMAQQALGVASPHRSVVEKIALFLSCMNWLTLIRHLAGAMRAGKGSLHREASYRKRPLALYTWNWTTSKGTARWEEQQRWGQKQFCFVAIAFNSERTHTFQVWMCSCMTVTQLQLKLAYIWELNFFQGVLRICPPFGCPLVWARATQKTDQY